MKAIALAILFCGLVYDMQDKSPSRATEAVCMTLLIASIACIIAGV